MNNAGTRWMLAYSGTSEDAVLLVQCTSLHYNRENLLGTMKYTARSDRCYISKSDIRTGCMERTLRRWCCRRFWRAWQSCSRGGPWYLKASSGGMFENDYATLFICPPQCIKLWLSTQLRFLPGMSQKICGFVIYVNRTLNYCENTPNAYKHTRTEEWLFHLFFILSRYAGEIWM